MSSNNIEKTLARAHRLIGEESYYEAHQVLRTVAARFIKGQHFDQAIELLYSGSQSLLKAGQGGSAGDLCLYLIEVYNIAKIKVNAESRARIVELLGLFKHDEPTRKKFIYEAIEWSGKYGNTPSGDSELHHFIGSLYANEFDPYNAEKHLLLGTHASSKVLTDCLWKWYKQSNEVSTSPLYISRAVFGYISIGNIRDAYSSLYQFLNLLLEDDSSLIYIKLNAPNSERVIYTFDDIPLLNFLQLLVVTAQYKSADMFKRLRNRYRENIKTINSLNSAIDKIGVKFFGINEPGSNDLLQSLMGSFFGGGSNASGSNSTKQLDFD